MVLGGLLADMVDGGLGRLEFVGGDICCCQSRAGVGVGRGTGARYERVRGSIYRRGTLNRVRTLFGSDS